MTRIYEALRKAESSRERSGAPRAGEGAPGWTQPTSDATLVPLPLVGGVDLTEDAIRENTALRLNLENALADRVPRSVMFSSAQGGEGTSTVALQSIVMQCWALTRPGAIARGQRATHGTRMPPSVRSILPPTSGQLSLKRSPPLSLVKITSVSSPTPWRCSAAITWPMPSSM